MTVIVYVIIILFLIMVGVVAWDSNRFVMREYTIESDKIENEQSFLFVSDLHCKSYGKNNEKLLSAIRSSKADFCVMGGDMVIGVKGKKTDTASDFIAKVKEEMPVICAYGNHELRMKLNPARFKNEFNEYHKKLDLLDIPFLENEKYSINGIDFYALSISHRFYNRHMRVHMSQKDLEGFIGKPQEPGFSVLLAHNPEYNYAYSEWGCDLTLSGHFHGGIVRIPGWRGVISPRLELFPKYGGGIIKENGSTMIVSRGLGSHSIPVRMFNPGELVLIHLKKH